MGSPEIRTDHSMVLERSDVCSFLSFVVCSQLTVRRLITIFLYMVAELSALQQIINALTGLNGLPVVIVECAVTTIYTCKCDGLDRSSDAYTTSSNGWI